MSVSDTAMSGRLTTSRPISAVGWVTLIVVYVAVTLALFFDTAQSIVSIWMRSQTFAHGFLVVPITLWLVWRKRRELARITPRPELWVLLLTAGGGAVWSLANVVDVQIVQQLALVGILITGVWALVGTQVVRTVMFPLGFLFAAVPMGEGLIMPLTNLTADSAEYLLRATGVPLLREGNFLTLPTGKWSVVEACSGIRYLIASVTLGLVYAYLAYQRWWKRALFVTASVIVPIAANSFRAYGVIMIGHLSNMKYGVGIDHLYYGWVLFAIVMLLLFWIGSFWEDPSSPVNNRSHEGVSSSGSASPAVPVLLIALVAAALGPALLWSMSRAAAPANLAKLSPPAAMASWESTGETGWEWLPNQAGADRELEQYYRSGDDIVGVFLYQYLSQEQGVELVDGAQPWRLDRSRWNVRGQTSVDVALAGGHGSVRIPEAVVISQDHELLVWTWYRIDGAYTANPYMAKLYEARQQVFQGYREGSRVFLATPLADSATDEALQRARTLLEEFLSLHHSAIAAVLDSYTATLGEVE